MPKPIYKVVDRELWQQAATSGKFRGAAIDLQDGYIHFSAADQLVATVQKHFAGRDNLVVAEIDSELLGDSLRWEVSRGGELFPHLYDSLNTALAEIHELPLKDGQHDFSGIEGVSPS